MAFNEKLGDRIRELFENYKHIEEKRMFGGLCFMLNDKMCVGVIHDDLMLRVSPKRYEELLEMPQCRPMDFTKKPMIGYLYVNNDSLKTKKDLKYFVDIAIEFNSAAKSSKKKK